MFKVFRRRTNATPLLRSRLCNEKAFYKFFIEDLLQAQRSVIIESPFITPRQVASLEDTFRGLIRRGIQITVYTRTPRQHDCVMAIKAREGIEILNTIGVRVRACANLMHWKLAFIDPNHETHNKPLLSARSYSISLISASICHGIKHFLIINRWRLFLATIEIYLSTLFRTDRINFVIRVLVCWREPTLGISR